MRLFLILLILLGGMMNANAEPVKIETDSFSIELPQGWKIKELTSQAKILGPNNELLIISSNRINGQGNESELKALKEELGNNIVATLKQAVNDLSLVITSELKKEISQSGAPTWQIQTETKDKSTFYYLFGTIGNKTALLITLEGGIKFKASGSIIKSAINRIKWN